MKRNKLFFSLSSISLIASFAFVCPFVINIVSKNNNQTNDHSLLISDKSNFSNSSYDITPYALTGQEKLLSFTFNADVSWKNNLTPNEITIENIKELLIPVDSGGIFTIEIQPITNADLSNGVVKFKIVQTRRTFVDGVPTSSIFEELVPGSGQGDAATKIWSTPSSYLIQSKYRFEWASEEQIKSFILGTNKTFETLSKEDVLNNLINSDYNLPSESNITFVHTDVSPGSRRDFGVGKILIGFSPGSTVSADWYNGIIPSTQEFVIRGLPNYVGVRSSMDLIFSPTNFGTILLNAAGITEFGKFLTNTANAKFNDLFLSQFINVNNGSTDTITQILTENLYTTILSKENATAKITYMGKLLSDPAFATITGIDPLIVDDLGIQSIEVTGNDLIGSMDVVYKYNVLNLYSNTVEELVKIQHFGGGTFAPNPDANKNLYFSWKTDSELTYVGTSYEIVNNFVANSSNNKYVNTLSGQFFNGTVDTYNEERIVNIDYAGGSSSPGIPNNLDDPKIKIDITFPTFNGNIYTDGSSVKTGLFASNIFDLKEYQYVEDTSGGRQVNWGTDKTLNDKNPSVFNFLPSEIIYSMFNSPAGITPLAELNNFLATPLGSQVQSQSQSFFSADDFNGTMTVRIFVQPIGMPIGSGQIYQQIFTGFKEEKNPKTYYEYSWIPQINVSQSLLNIPILNVTPQNVIDEYLSKIPLFADKVLSSSNVSVEINPSEDTSLLITVTIPIFNQGLATPGNQTFQTIISGFSAQADYVNNAKANIPENYTTILAVTISSFVVVVMGVILGVLVVKTINAKKFTKKE